MSVNSYLNDTASKLVLNYNEKLSIATSKTAFINRMNSYFKYHESVDLLDVIEFGSSQRETNLPKSVDSNTDVDIMLVLSDDNATPQTYLDRVRRALEYEYNSSDIKQSSPTIRLLMNHITFEITPAIKFFTGYRIKSGDEWLITYAYQDFDNLSKCNQLNNSMVKPLIRLLKYWNVTKNDGSFSSYKIEKIVINEYSSNRFQGYDYKKYLLTGFKDLYSLCYSDNQRNRLDVAISNVEYAINNELEYPNTSLDKIKKIIKEI